jgi:YD repeat-containing protein
VGVFSIALAAATASCRQPPPPKTATPETVRPTYDESGALTKLEADSDHDGLIDMWAYMDGPRVVRVEVDENGDGTVDRWEYHRQLPDDAAPKAEGSSAPPKMPRPVKLVQLRGGGLESPDKTIERIERATHADGVVSRWEYFENGFLVRIEADMNGDGKIDKWETYNDGHLAMLTLDTLHRGTPDRRLVYRPDGQLDRIEIDPSGTGMFRPLSQPAK